MGELLKALLDRLDLIGSTHHEIYDTECRERMSDVVFNGFIRPVADSQIPDDFGLYSADANALVREALANYIDAARDRGMGSGLRSFHDRLASFQDGKVCSNSGSYYDDFFGYSAPEAFNEAGEVIVAP